MRIGLERGDKVTMHSAEVLLRIFQTRNFFLTEEDRLKFAEDLGGKTGTVSSIEEKWQFDYFYFLPDGNEPHQTYSLPYESVDFNHIPKSL